jgi:CheY-like chemotaxis protein
MSHRILINGLTNAIKFTEKGSITLKLSTNEDRTKVIIQIIDTGIGIEAKFAPRLFEPFTKSDSFSSGAGLGLYITKGLVDRMNGTLVLAPNEKGGTTFEVVLPVQMVDPAEGGGKIRSKPVKGFLLNLETENEDQEVTPEGQGQTDAAGQTEPDLSPDSNSTSSPGRQQTKPAVAPTKTTPSTAPSEAVRVLVVDDNEISRKLLLMALKRSPTKVMTAQAMDGREAVQKFREFKPDLVLTDVSMPVMDGLTAAGKMRQVEDGRDGELGPRDERRSSETEDGEDSGCGCDQSGDNRYKTRIFAITGLGSSDPRLKNDALRGGASLDGWLVKGEHGLEVIYKIVKETLEKRNDRRASA